MWPTILANECTGADEYKIAPTTAATALRADVTE